MFIGLGANRKRICDFLLVINGNFGLSPTVYDILTFKTIQNGLMACFPHTPLLDVPAWGNPLEFLDKTYPTKTRGMGLQYGKNFII